MNNSNLYRSSLLCLLLILLSINAASAAEQGAAEVGIPGKIHSIITPEGTIQFFFIPAPGAELKGFPEETFKTVQNPWAYAVGTMDLAAFGEKPTTTFQIRSDKGNIAGYWVGPETPESAKALTSAVAPGWTLTKMGAFNPKDIATSTKAFPIPRSVVMESLREELLQRATDLACKSRIRPKEVSVTAALEASIGFIVGGAGSISFQATWETEKLCQ